MYLMNNLILLPIV